MCRAFGQAVFCHEKHKAYPPDYANVQADLSLHRISGSTCHFVSFSVLELLVNRYKKQNRTILKKTSKSVTTQYFLCQTFSVAVAYV